jgi:hypothetical protein
MKITQYIKALLPVVSKSTMLEDIRFARNQLTELQDIYSRADKSFGKFKSEDAKRIQSSFASITHSGTSKNILVVISEGLPNVIKTLSAVEALVAGEFEETIATRGLTAKRANLMQLTDASTFIVRYCIKLYTFVLKHEIIKARAEKGLENGSSTTVSEYEDDVVIKGLVPFCTAWNVFSMPSAKMADVLEALPEVIVTDANYSTLKQTMGDAKLDPFAFSTSNFMWSPIRAVRMRREEAAHARYEEMVKEVEMAKLRLEQLRQIMQGKEDASLDREITYLQNLVDQLNSDIADMES